MSELSQPFQSSKQIFLNFLSEIQLKKIGDISIRRAIKKYEVKNLKINNVTPLRARKMYSIISSKYCQGLATDKSWLENERRLFIWCTLCYLFKNDLEIDDLKLHDFQFLNQMFPCKDLNLIKFQTYSLVKKNNKSNGWTSDEDHLLLKLVNNKPTQGLEWSIISKEFFVQSGQRFFRNAKQCRERWLNYLDPKKEKGRWEPKQDIILLQEVLEKGKKWSKIVESLGGKKNQHMIKNRFKSLIHKKQKTLKDPKKKQNDLIKLILNDYAEEPQENRDASYEYLGSGIKESDSKIQYEGSFENECVKSQYNENKDQNLQKKCEDWPIVIKSGNKEQGQEKVPENQKPVGTSIEVYGSKEDQQFVNNLFINVGNTINEENRYFPSVVQNRSPVIQGHFITNSPFQACWTPSAVFYEDPQVMSSPLGFADFCSTARNFTSWMERKS